MEGSLRPSFHKFARFPSKSDFVILGIFDPRVLDLINSLCKSYVILKRRIVVVPMVRFLFWKWVRCYQAIVPETHMTNSQYVLKIVYLG